MSNSGIISYKPGELNPLEHPNSGRTIDPTDYTGKDQIRQAADFFRTPSFLKKLTSPLKAICIRIEEHQLGEDLALCVPCKTKPDSFLVRARIPEIHSHIPDFTTYGPEAPEGLVRLYPAFISNEGALGVERPSPGEIIWVDFRDRQLLLGPMYLGRANRKPYSGGFRTTQKPSSSGAATGPATGGLAAAPPPGDGIGGNSATPNSQQPTKIQSERPEPNYGPDPNAANNVTLQPAYRKGEFIGNVRTIMWKNPNGKSKRMVFDLVKDLQDLNSAMYQQIGMVLYVNSGFRTNAEQQYFYDLWKSGNGNKAAPAGRSNHQSGRAMDFSVWNYGAAKNKKTALIQNRKAWDWMNQNARNYRFTWVEGRGINEPWHWNYVGQIEGSNEEDRKYVNRLIARDNKLAKNAQSKPPSVDAPSPADSNGGNGEAACSLLEKNGNQQGNGNSTAPTNQNQAAANLSQPDPLTDDDVYPPKHNSKISSLRDDVIPLFENLVQKIAEKNLPMKLWETLRTQRRQDYLYSKGRTREQLDRVGITLPAIPNNPEGTVTDVRNSRHISGTAADFILDSKHPYWKEKGVKIRGGWDTSTPEALVVWGEFGKLAKELGFNWGGAWTVRVDRPHVQTRKNQTIPS